MKRKEYSKNMLPETPVVKVKQKWQKPELLKLNTGHTQFALPDVADGGGPYS